MTAWFTTWWSEIAATFVKCFIKDQRWTLLLEGLGVTVKVSLAAAILGLVIGLIIAACNLSKIKIFNIILCPVAFAVGKWIV